jgi:ABC-2 type transport system permease protein
MTARSPAVEGAKFGTPTWGGFDPARTRGRGIGDLRRAFATATRLGWQMEANWTDPVLFFIYSVAKPISSALIFVVMIDVIGGGSTRELRGFVVVGTALWSFVMSGIAGLAWSVLDDRERYRMLKYVYVSPSSFLVVLLGRGVARIAVGAMGALITLAVGIVFLSIPISLAAIDWPMLVAVMIAGLVTIVAVGMMLAAVCLQTRQESWSYPEAAAGALFLVSGAVFPLSVLPAPAQVIGYLSPLSWWIEGIRRAIMPNVGPGALGGPGSLFTELSGRAAPGSPEIILALLVTGAVVTLGAIVGFRLSDHRARDRGLLDQTTGS